MITIGVLILGIIGGAYLKEKELKEKSPTIIVEPKTLIEQADKACEGYLVKFKNRDLRFECNIRDEE